MGVAFGGFVPNARYKELRTSLMSALPTNCGWTRSGSQITALFCQYPPNGGYPNRAAPLRMRGDAIQANAQKCGVCRYIY